MTLKPERVVDGERDPNAARSSQAAVALDTFVINLCSSTTPMALAQPDTPELKRFQFFVSRRLEDGRERFRLHMGHFKTLEEAEDWLSVVRDVYPGAWAGEAPGKRLRAKSAPVPSAVPPQPMNSLAGQSIDSASQPRSSPPAAAPGAEGVAPTAAAQRRPPLRADAPAGARRPHVESAVPPSAPPALRAPLSNVREVLAALDETDAPQSAPMPPADAMRARSLSDTEVMQILEARRAEEPVHAISDTPGGIPMLRPDDSGTRRALHSAVQSNAAVSFAVQLQWSAEPMALDKVPPLAIFSAYTLYTVEGSREGRTWYGLRLGFFSDATAAKQVAHYVRSDFSAVAVVPVSPEERGRAASAEQPPAPIAFAERAHTIEPPEIKLLDDVTAVEPRPARVRANSAKSGSAAAMRSKTQRSRERAAHALAAHSLEETLEILGAGSLELDNGRGELLNHSGVRHLKVELRKDSPFQRLVARLTERVRKS